MTHYIVPNEATHVAVTVIEFSDGGEPEESVLGFGSFDECDRLARSVPAISYSGPRPTKQAFARTYELNPLCSACHQRHQGECASLGDVAAELEGK